VLSTIVVGSLLLSMTPSDQRRKTNKVYHPVEFALTGWYFYVHMTGFEPALPCENYDLNVARLPIPPHMHSVFFYVHTVSCVCAGSWT
jgi:hypothetical protein